MRVFLCLITYFLFLISTGKAQTFSLETKSDTLHVLVLTTDSTESRWRLPYPVYRFCTGDVDGNGTIDALVGVEKATRYYPCGPSSSRTIRATSGRSGWGRSWAAS